MRAVYIIAILTFGSLITLAQDNTGFAKRIEAQYKPIKGDSVWASQCECTNGQYREFLDALFEKGDRNNYALNKPDSTGWSFARVFPGNKSDNTAIAAVYSSHPSYVSHPVVNITFYSAIAYCEWLTRKYNNTPDRKFKRVVFRLPDAEEWKFAARGIAPKVKPPMSAHRYLPWNGFTYKDSKGRYLANFAPMHDASVRRDENYYLRLTDSTHFSMMAADGFTYQAPCDKSIRKFYKPNEYGLYHMAGNVSEYILEAGNTKGGSFISPGYYLLIDTDEPEFKNEMLGGPFIGFRPFMFVVER